MAGCDAAVLSLVERGWRGARECSRRLTQEGIPVSHVIRGRLPADFDELVPPEPGLRVRGVSRSWFRAAVWCRLACWAPGGRIRWLVADNERTLRAVARWCRAAGIRALLLQETSDGYELVEDGVVRTFEEAFKPPRPCG